MDFYSVWPVFVCVVVVLALVASPAFAAADTPPAPIADRSATIDGLRGVLALAVLFHHAAIYHDFLRIGVWRLPPSRFHALLGPIGVSMFFMITGYLFWSRLVRDGGRAGWVRLFIGRVFRIGPLYLTAILIVVIIAFVAADFSLRAPWPDVMMQIGAWLPLGFSFGPDINGYVGTGLLLAYVTWSIHYEWLFYLSLPFIAVVARFRRIELPVVAAALAACLVRAAWAPQFLGNAVLAALFLVGMLCASLHRRGVRARLPNGLMSLLTVAALGAVFLFQNPYGWGPVLLLGTAFYLITSGCSVFGLLMSRPARRLGDISYGIYLLQGLVLAAVFRPPLLRGAALASPLQHWGLVLISAILLIAAATLAHRLVERPGIMIGRRLSVFLSSQKSFLLLFFKKRRPSYPSSSRHR